MQLLTLIEKLNNHQELSSEEGALAAQLLAETSEGEVTKRDFLKALNLKGESAGEVAAFAKTFRNMARVPDLGALSQGAIDVCGTGGDGSGTFNISTMVGFLLAASGVPVVKHGNRSITSKCGSADILEAIGFDLTPDDATLKRSLEALNFVFLFAPNFHPAFKHIVPVRKALAAEGRRSIFNILGPLINPASPPYQLLGVFSDDWVDSLASALNALGLKRGLVVNAQLPDGRSIDELTCAGENIAYGVGELGQGPVKIDLQSLGLAPCAFEDLAGGDVQQNLVLLDQLLTDQAPAGLRDTILLNAGAGLWIAERAPTFREGVDLARETLHNGTLRTWLQSIQSFYKK